MNGKISVLQLQIIINAITKILIRQKETTDGV